MQNNLGPVNKISLIGEFSCKITNSEKIIFECTTKIKK